MESNNTSNIDALGSLNNLEELYASCNRIKEIPKIPNLKTLEIRGNFEILSVDNILDMANLEMLDISCSKY